MNFFRSKRSGFTLLELIVATGVFGLLTMVIATVLSQVFKMREQNQMVSTRDEVVIQTRMAAANIMGLRASISKPNNLQLKQCICGGGCLGWENFALELWNSGGTEQLTPRFYDANGTPCQANEPKCFFQVTAIFIAQCRPPLPSPDPTPPANCNMPAEFLNVRITVEKNPNSAPAPIPIKPVVVSVFNAVRDIAPPMSGVCL